MEAATVRERYGNARGLSVAATVSNPIGHHPYLHDSTRGSQTSLWVERSSTSNHYHPLCPAPCRRSAFCYIIVIHASVRETTAFL
jgi:hypothetical protein